MSDDSRVCVRDVMKHNYDMVDGMMTVEDALREMKHKETKH